MSVTAIRVAEDFNLPEFEPLPADRVLPVIEERPAQTDEEEHLEAVAFLWMF